MLRTLLSRGPARVGLLAALIIALAPSGASAFSKAIWGQVYRDGVNQFPIYKQLGVSIWQGELPWSQVAPTRPRDAKNPNDPAYQWPVGIQQAIDQARQFHMRVMLQIIFAPPWANHNRGQTWTPSNPRNYADFAIAAARRYPSVHLWMIWGEPNRKGMFLPFYAAPPGAALTAQQQIAPHNYARLLDVAYGALKAVSRRNVVIGGSTYTSGQIDTQQWIENMVLPNGRRPRMDMYAHNPFTFVDPNTVYGAPSQQGLVQFVDLGRLAQWIDRYLHRGIPLFLSEFTIPTCPDTEFNFWVDAPVAAKWVRHALAVSRRWKRIYALGWINVYDTPGFSCGGLFTAGGQKKPTFNGFAQG